MHQGDVVIDIMQVAARFETFFLPLLRIGGMMLAAPIFGIAGTSARIRVMIALGIGLCMVPGLPAAEPPQFLSAHWFLTLATETVRGIAIGFVLRLTFESVALAGELIATSIGLGFAQLNDPLRGANAAVISRLNLMLATALFFTIDGHLALIRMVVDSFSAFPVGQGGFVAGHAKVVLGFTAQVLLVGVQIALPIIVIMLVTNISFGFVSRTAPAINVIAVGMPIALVIGMFVLTLTIAAMQKPLENLLIEAWGTMRLLFG